MSSSGRLAALQIAGHSGGGSVVGLIAKRTYQVSGGACLVAEEQVALAEAPRVTEDDAVLLHDIDTVLNRAQVDVVVAGNAYSPGRQRRFDVRVRLGRLDRQLVAFGDRRCWLDTLGHVRFSGPEPVTSIDVGWGAAYGGVDAAAKGKHGDPLESFCRDQGTPYNPCFGLYAYPRNRAGKGYVIEPTREALDACALPNLEDPAHLLSPERLVVHRPDRWPSAPPAASLGWLSYGSFPRSAMLGLTPAFDAAACPPAGMIEVRMEVLSAKSITSGTALFERMDIRVTQQSAVGMRVAEVAPGSPVELVNLHRHHPSWSFELPSEVPLLALQMPGASPISLQPKVRTVLLEPDLDRVCLTWVGEHHEPTPVGPGKRAHIRFGVKWRS